MKMVEFTVKAGLLVKALEQVRAEGKDEKGTKINFVENCLISVTDNKLQIYSSDMSNILYTRVFIKNITVKSKGNIPIDFSKKNDKILPTLKRYNSSDVKKIIQALYEFDFDFDSEERPPPIKDDAKGSFI